MGVVPIERVVALFQEASGWPAAPRIEAAVNDRPPDAVAPVIPLAAIVVRRGSCRGDSRQLGGRARIRRFWTVGGLHRDTIPLPKGPRQARCVIMCACEALYFRLELFSGPAPTPRRMSKTRSVSAALSTALARAHHFCDEIADRQQRQRGLIGEHL